MIVGDYVRTDIERHVDVVVCFAFIHLFPARVADVLLQKMWSELRPGGLLFIGTTKSSVSREGVAPKADFPGSYKRFRKHWTHAELAAALAHAGFKMIADEVHVDPYGKPWMDFVVRRPGGDIPAIWRNS